ncbi:class I SAM-dependent methyltransferase [Sinorhizobium meliloti]|uniref:class I SAM-dependent methyltransferase n=1 Tax=Rhizobium meliloti TaxID=382 RepID=UPI00398D2FDB
MYRACPVCKGTAPVPTITRERIPILQNRVYDTKKEAIAAPTGQLTLCTCSQCGFCYNGEFNESLVCYDEHYNNDVPSRTFELYAEKIARALIERFDLTSGTVYDVGCGKGAFLRTLCKLAPNIRGIGIDPSCTPTTDENFTLIRDIFRPGSFASNTKLVVLRHVLEHITEPVTFLRELGQAAPEIPLYIEVPEVHWIFENGAFWDFCYEHCNYFCRGSLRNALERAGFSVIEQGPAFGGQYQWAIGTANNLVTTPTTNGADAIAAAMNYKSSENLMIERARSIIATSDNTAVWGMATKGVMLSCLVGTDLISAGIDINPKKQEKFAPLSGVRIHAPAWLKSHPVKTILVMNGNYAAEIRQMMRTTGIAADIVVM